MSRRELRLPDTTLNMMPSQELEAWLIMLRPLENYVMRCPASSPDSNVTIAALTAWLQTHQEHNVQTHPYAALVTHIQSTEDKHLDMWRQLGLSPMAWERLWTAIRMIKAHGPPKRITVRAGTVVTVLRPDAHPPAAEGTIEHTRRDKYQNIKCCVMSTGLDDTGAAIAHAAPLPREAQTESALLA